MALVGRASSHTALLLVGYRLKPLEYIYIHPLRGQPLIIPRKLDEGIYVGPQLPLPFLCNDPQNGTLESPGPSEALTLSIRQQVSLCSE